MSGIIIPDAGTIGSASDNDAISIASSGKATFSAGIANTGTIDAGSIGNAVTMSADQACVKTALNAGGCAPIYSVRAWICFDGVDATSDTDLTGVRSSGNVTSLTADATGRFSVNLTTAMEDTSGAIVTGQGNDASDSNNLNCEAQWTNTSKFTVQTCHTHSSGHVDGPNIFCAVIR